MGLAKRARLSAALTAPNDLPPAADLSTICIVRRDKRPASVIALAGSRQAAADGSAKPSGDGMFYKKGSATAATFRPAYWSYEPDPSQLAGPVASLERQLDARRRSTSPSTAPIEAKSEEKPLASLDAAPAIRKLAPSPEPLPPVSEPPIPTRTSPERAELDAEAIEALLRPLPNTAAMPEEVRATPAVVEQAPSAPAKEAMPPPLAPAKIREEPAVLPAELTPPADPPFALPVAPPPSAEVSVGAAPPEELQPTPAVVAPVPPTPAAEAMPPPLAPSKLREEVAVLPAESSPPKDRPLARPVAPPPPVEEPIAAAPLPPTSASVASESAAPSGPATAAPEVERSRPSAAPARKRPSQEAAKRVEEDSAEFDALGAAIDSVLATRWYGSERSGFTAPRPTRSDIAPVTPSGLIAELATVQKEPEAVPPRSRGRRGRIIAALSLVAVFALTFAAALLGRTGHGTMLPMRVLPAIFGAASLPEATLALVDIYRAAPEQVARS